MKKMKKYQKVDFLHPEAKKFSDLGGIQDDLNQIVLLCDYVINDLEDITYKDSIIIDAIHIACVIRYYRCFHKTGKRISLDLDDIEKLPLDYREVHNIAKNTRDKHIAHAVNHFEKCYCEAHLTAEDGGEIILDKITVGHERVASSKKQVWAFKQLVLEVQKIVNEKLDSEEKRLFTLFQGLSEDEKIKYKPHVALDPNFKKSQK